MESKPEVTHPIRVVRTVTLTQDTIERMISCPVSGQIYHQAVVLIGSGYTLEMEVALKLMESDNPICPITKKPITGFEVNRGMMDLVDHYLALYPYACAEQYTPNAELADGSVPQAAPNNSQDLDAQAHDVRDPPVLPVQPPLPLPNPAVAIVNAPNRIGLFRAQPLPVSYSVPIVVLIKTVPVQQVDMFNGKIKLACVSIGGNTQEKKQFASAVAPNTSSDHHRSLGLIFSLVEHNSCYYQLSTLVRPGAMLDAGQRGIFRKSDFVMIFASDDIEHIDRWIDLARDNIPNSQLYWVDGTAVVGQRLVACQELPRESLLLNRFSTLSRSDCNLVGLQLFEEAKTQVLKNVNVVRQEAPQSQPEESKCSLM